MSGLRSIDWDSVAPLNPFDRTASMVTGKGESFALVLDPGKLHQQTPIPFRPLRKQERQNPEFVDFTGMRVGRLTVLGLAVAVKGSRKTGVAWVVRCVCGAYEIRRGRYLKACAAGKKKNGDREPCCDWCDKTHRLKAGHGAGIPEDQKHFNRLRREAGAVSRENCAPSRSTSATARPGACPAPAGAPAVKGGDAAREVTVEESPS